MPGVGGRSLFDGRGGCKPGVPSTGGLWRALSDMIFNACRKPAVAFQMVQVEQRGILSIKKTKIISSSEDIVNSPLC